MSNNKYDYALDMNEPVTKSTIQQIAPGSTVLEFGPAMGRLTRYLKEELGCRVSIVELDEEGYASAIQFAEKGLQGDIENLAWEDTFPAGYYDYAIFADVLEHLTAPDAVLRRVTKLLKPDGKLITSIPNITYSGVVGSMLTGKFQYNPLGILDNTHLRFFTTKSVYTLLENAGFFPIIIEGFPNAVECSEFAEDFALLPTYIGEYLQDHGGGITYENYAVAVKAEYAEKNPNLFNRKIASAEPATFPSFLFYDAGNGYEESHKCVAQVTPGKDQTLTFCLPDNAATTNVRWDPVYNRCFNCRNVFLLSGNKVIYPAQNSAQISFEGTDYFDRKNGSYIFIFEEPVHVFTIHFSLEVDYVGDAKQSLLFRVYKTAKDAETQNLSLAKQLEEQNLSFAKQLEEQDLAYAGRLETQNDSFAEQLKAQSQALKEQAEAQARVLEAKERSHELALEKANGQIHALEDKLDSQLRTAHSAVRHHATTAHNLRGEYYALLEQKRHLEMANAAANDTIQHQQQQINHLNATLEALYHSTSWRVSRPIRLLKTLLTPTPNQPHAEVISDIAVKESEKAELQDLVVSFIIPTYNAGDDLGKLLTLLLGQDGLGEKEVVVVDSGSIDGTPEKAEYLGARVIRIPNENFSHSYARNLGAKQAKGDIFVFMTQDALPDGYCWAHDFLQPLVKQGIAAVSCIEQPKPGTELYGRINIWGHHIRFMGLNGIDRVASLPAEADTNSIRINANLNDVACATLRSVFLKYLYRGEYGEDLDYGVRLIQDGYSLAFMSSVKVIHSHNRSAYYYLKRSFVENFSLADILPNLPQQAFELPQLLGHVMYAYSEVCSLRRWFEHYKDADLSIEEFEYDVWGYLNIDVLFNEINLNSKPPMPTGERDLDLLLVDIWKLAATCKPMNISWINTIKEYVFELILPYLREENVGNITPSVREDILDAILKHFVARMGHWLYSFYTQDPEDQQAKDLCDRLFGGV